MVKYGQFKKRRGDANCPNRFPLLVGCPHLEGYCHVRLDRHAKVRWNIDIEILHIDLRRSGN